MIYFFSKTWYGYVIYLFFLFYGCFSCSNNCNITHSLAALFTFWMVGLTLQTYILLNLPHVRQWLENLLGKDFLIQHLGEYTNFRVALFTIATFAIPSVGCLTIDMITASIEEEKLLELSRQIKSDFDKEFFNNNRTLTDQLEKMLDKQHDLVVSAADAKGIFSRIFSNGKL